MSAARTISPATTAITVESKQRRTNIYVITWRTVNFILKINKNYGILSMWVHLATASHHFTALPLAPASRTRSPFSLPPSFCYMLQEDSCKFVWIKWNTRWIHRMTIFVFHFVHSSVCFNVRILYFSLMSSHLHKPHIVYSSLANDMPLGWPQDSFLKWIIYLCTCFDRAHIVSRTTRRTAHAVLCNRTWRRTTCIVVARQIWTDRAAIRWIFRARTPISCVAILL